MNFQPAKAPKATTTRAKANANGTKTSKPAAAKKSRITKAKLLRTDSPNAESDNASHDGGLSADDEASSSANGKVNGDSEAAAAAAHKLAGSILSVKRKAEEMDEADGKVAIKKEKVESEDEGEDDEAIEEESQRTGGTPSEQLWAEVSYGMNDHEMTAA